MKLLKSILYALGVMLFMTTGVIAAELRAVPPNMIGLMLTPTGFDGQIYQAGQVDIGRESWGGYGNKLILLQRSGFDIKEQFIQESPNDSEDHRCTVGPNREPMTLDVRLLFALPDYNTEQGQQAILRMGLLGNPEPYAGAGGDRVMLLDAASIYMQQVRLQVRGKIRDICLGYESVEAVYQAAENNGNGGFSDQVKAEVATVLAENNSPLLLVDAVVSNIKEDPTVVQATASLMAAEKLVEAMATIDDFISEDPTGRRELIFKLMVMQGIVTNNDGTNTMFMTDIAGAGNFVPLPVQ